MRLPSGAASERYRALLLKECRELLRTKSLWTMLALLSFITGYSFIQAVRLYSEASRTALPFPEMARAMTPVNGVLVPTFGAYYLAASLLFPLIAIRLIGNEKQSGSIKLLLQLPLDTASLIGVKVVALALAWFALLAPGLLAIAVWLALGGHVFWPETLNLIAGHSLLAFAVAGIAFVAAAVADSVSTAAISALAFTLGSWILDFAAGTEGGLAKLSFLSLTAALRPFEQGVLSLDAVLQLAVTGLALLALTGIHLGRMSARRKAVLSALALLASALLWTAGRPLNWSADVSEERRNSFNPAVERALRRIDQPLKITVHLSPDDSRLADLERNVLDKLRRSVPRLKVIYAGQAQASADGRDDYGLIAYEYGSKREESRSNSEEEILPILFTLSGQSVVADAVPEYPGYPLVADAGAWGVWFYVVLPAACFLAAWFNGRSVTRRIS